jgi:hypothetical protein
MLDQWGNADDNNVEKLVDALRKMKNRRVMEMFQNELKKKGESCNCPNCKHLT